MNVKLKVKEGKSGDWRISRFTVDAEEARECNWGMYMNGSSERAIKPGAYWKLMCGKAVVMSNTPAELYDLKQFREMCRICRGRALLNGLGLGVALQMAVDCPRMKTITVIENSPDVIKLVKPAFKDERVEIIEADALEWEPPKGRHYEIVWHDIWNTIGVENLVEMKKLRRKYKDISTWQGYWAEYKVLEAAEEEDMLMKQCEIVAELRDDQKGLNDMKNRLALELADEVW